MALVVLLKGINVGGHRTLRPSALAKDLKHFDVVNIGAAGTFVVRKPVGRAMLRGEISRRLPFAVDVMMCSGSEILRLASDDPFAGQTPKPTIVHFVSVMGRRRKPPTAFPLNFPAEGPWCLRVLDCRGRFVVGLHRREMRAIRYLRQLDEVFHVPLATRSWSTISAIARILRD